jgi:hypothetical protein
MHRFGFLATIVALVSVITFSAGALISGAQASRDAGSMPTAKSANTVKPAPSPGGKPVRVISLSPGDSSAAPGTPALPQAPLLASAEPGPIALPVAAEEARAEEAKAAVEEPAARHMAARSHPAPKRSAAAPARMRAAARTEKPFIVSGLF